MFRRRRRGSGLASNSDGIFRRRARRHRRQAGPGAHRLHGREVGRCHDGGAGSYAGRSNKRLQWWPRRVLFFGRRRLSFVWTGFLPIVELVLFVAAYEYGHDFTIRASRCRMQSLDNQLGNATRSSNFVSRSARPSWSQVSGPCSRLRRSAPGSSVQTVILFPCKAPRAGSTSDRSSAAVYGRRAPNLAAFLRHGWRWRSCR